MSVAIQRPSPRVSLRPAVPRDAEYLRAWRAEESVRRYQPLNELTVGQLRTDVASHRMSDLYRSRGEKFQWIVLIDDHPAGWITLVVSNWEHGLAEVGYALSTQAQGQGVMTEALRLLIDDLFTDTHLERIEARCAEGNLASQRVLEKLGFEREGLLRSYFRLPEGRVDNYLFSLLRSDWG
ncbi:MAG: GNAT family N-acetyltransferase [Acidobacteriota bacterium]